MKETILAILALAFLAVPSGRAVTAQQGWFVDNFGNRTPFAPVPTSAASVVAAAKFIKSSGSHSVNRNARRKRVRQRKSPAVHVKPDSIQVITWREYWRGVEAARAVAWVRWF